MFQVIKFAVEVDADSEKFPESWIFHNRWNKKGGEVDGKHMASWETLLNCILDELLINC